MKSSNPYWYWRACGSGDQVSQSPSEVDTAHCGRWRFQRIRGHGHDRLAVWPSPFCDGWYCYQFNDEAIKSCKGEPQIRGFAFAKYASIEDYQFHADNGVWPGEVANLIANTQVSDADQVLENIKTMAADARRWLAQRPNITTQEQADTAANYRISLSSLAKKADDLRKVEKGPLDRAVDACQKRWMPSITEAKEVSTDMLRAVEPFLVAQKEDMDARRAAERKEREDTDIVLAVLDVPRRGSVMLEKVSAGGQVGRKVGVKDTWTAVITDYDAALNHFKNHEKVVELISSLAGAAARSKEKPAIPGVEFKKEMKAT